MSMVTQDLGYRNWNIIQFELSRRRIWLICKLLFKVLNKNLESNHNLMIIMLVLENKNISMQYPNERNKMNIY